MNLKTNKLVFIGLAISITLQITFLFVPGFFNDLWRYLWDGHMLIHGINPHLLTPWEVFDTPSLHHLTEVWYWEQLYFKWSNTSYGPTLQYLFALAQFIRANSVFTLKLIFFVANIGSIIVGMKILRLLERSPRHILWLALSPLFLFDTLLSTHTESIIIFLFLLTCYAHLRRDTTATAISYTFLLLTKFFPILLLPILLLHKKKKDVITFLFIVAVLSTILYLPFTTGLESLSLLFESFRQMRAEWVMSPGIFALLEHFTDYTAAKRLSTILTLLTAGIAYYQYYRRKDIFSATYLVLLGLIIYSSVVFSWYVLWIVWLIPFIDKKASTVVLSLTVFAQYLLYYADPVEGTELFRGNGEVLWNQLVIWVPFFLVLIGERLYRKKKQKPLLIYMSRLPIPGLQGKTRIGREIGDQAPASALAEALILDTLHAYAESDVYEFLYAYEGDWSAYHAPEGVHVDEYTEQKGETIGEREAYLHQTFGKGRPVIIVGSDIPLLTQSDIESTFDALRDYDVIIRPAEDGGYVSIGSRRYHDLYTDITNWDSRTPDFRLTEETIAIARAQTLKTYVAEPRYDIDTLTDVRRLWDTVTERGALKKEYLSLIRTYTVLKTYRNVFELT